MDIQIGDIGIIRGHLGYFCVRAGACLPDNLAACNPRAVENADESEALVMTDGTVCWRTAFVPIGVVTDDDEERAGIRGWYEPFRSGAWRHFGVTFCCA